MALSSAMAASSVLLLAAGNRLRLPGGVELKGVAEDILSKTGQRYGGEVTRSLLEKKLVQANLNISPEYFSGLQIALPIITLVLSLPLSFMGAIDVYWALLPAVIAYFAPGLWLNGKAKRRIAKIKADIPDFCVMLGNALSSGADLLMALEKVSGAMKGELAGEIKRTLADIGAGDSRTEALDKLSRRCGIPELTGLVRKIQQAIRYGSEKLEGMVMHHAEKMLEKQKTSAQKAAGELTIKLLFPIVIFILLPLFVFIGFPIAWSVLKVF